VMHQGASLCDGVVKQRHRAGRPSSSQALRSPGLTPNLVPFLAGPKLRGPGGGERGWAGRAASPTRGASDCGSREGSMVRGGRPGPASVASPSDAEGSASDELRPAGWHEGHFKWVRRVLDDLSKNRAGRADTPAGPPHAQRPRGPRPDRGELAGAAGLSSTPVRTPARSAPASPAATPRGPLGRLRPRRSPWVCRARRPPPRVRRADRPSSGVPARIPRGGRRVTVWT